MIINPYIFNSSVAPTNTVAPVISGTQVVGSTLSTTDGTWTGTPTITYSYQWRRNGSNILGANSSTYTLVQADAGNTANITCNVTATNTAGSVTATSNTLSQILDSNANTFLSVTSITDNTQKNALNTLVIDLKSNNLWNKMYAIYPFIGGTATTHKYNLKDPQDTDAAYRLLFNGGWTHSSTGVLGNGTNTYANTRLGMNILPQNSAHTTIYCRTNTIGNRVEMGTYYTTIGFYSLLCARLSNNFLARINSTAVDGSISNTDSQGFYQVYRTDATDIKSKKSAGAVNTFARASVSAASNTFPYFIGDLNFNSTPLGYYTNREYAFASLGEGYTDSDAANLYTIVQNYNTTLSRQI